MENQKEKNIKSELDAGIIEGMTGFELVAEDEHISPTL